MGELLEILKNVPVGGVSFAGLVAFFILQIFQGNIIPSKTYDLIKAGWDTIIVQKDKEIDTLKQAYSLSEKAREASAEDVKQLLVLAHTTVHLLESVNEKAEEARP